MSNEIFTSYVVLIAGILLAAEYLWLYVAAQNQEKYLKRKKNRYNEISSLYKSALSAPTLSIREKEIDSLNSYVGNDNFKYYDAVNIYIDYASGERLSENQKMILRQIYERLDPEARLIEILENVNNNEKAYVIRLISSLNLAQHVPNLKKYLRSRNKNLSYHTGMALSQLGDEESTLEFIKLCGENHTLSSRVIMEILCNYSGDKASLVKQIYGDVDDYMKSTVIKGLKNDRLYELKDIYREGVLSKSAAIRNACVKALSAFGDIEDEHTLITAMNDQDWVVRLSAIEGLERIGTATCLEAIIKATSDDEWWIRRNAAAALVRIDPTLENVENVIRGYDRYAADAVKSALSKEVY